MFLCQNHQSILNNNNNFEHTHIMKRSIELSRISYCFCCFLFAILVISTVRARSLPIDPQQKIVDRSLHQNSGQIDLNNIHNNNKIDDESELSDQFKKNRIVKDRSIRMDTKSSQDQQKKDDSIPVLHNRNINPIGGTKSSSSFTGGGGSFWRYVNLAIGVAMGLSIVVFVALIIVQVVSNDNEEDDEDEVMPGGRGDGGGAAGLDPELDSTGAFAVHPSTSRSKPLIARQLSGGGANDRSSFEPNHHQLSNRKHEDDYCDIDGGSMFSSNNMNMKPNTTLMVDSENDISDTGVRLQESIF